MVLEGRSFVDLEVEVAMSDPFDASLDARPGPTARSDCTVEQPLAPRRQHEGGQATTLLLACVVLITLAAVGVGELGARIVARQHARAAADAAALAGTTSGWSGAQRLASANGARLVSFAEHDDEVTVTVEVGGERATARATDGP